LLAAVLASDAPCTEAAVRSDLFPNESRNLLYGARWLVLLPRIWRHRRAIRAAPAGAGVRALVRGRRRRGS
jgi:hypothetical protein